MNELVVLLEGKEAGRVTRTGDRLAFRYNDGWRSDPLAYPLSLSMPLAARDHPHRVINAFIWGLLPDNDRTLERWARQFQVAARNGFALIGHVGEDCAGAVQFVRPERLDAIQQGGDIEWIDETEVGRRLRSVLADAGTGRSAGDNGQFSLAGAQPKTALLRDGKRWGIPSGRVPTTHILKPPSPALPGNAENEHFCLQVAAELGMRTAKSEVLNFDGQPAICVARYDRYRLGSDPAGPLFIRLHQEDMCQALAVHPEQKYENEGGPGAARILNLIRESVYEPLAAGSQLDGAAAEDIRSFVDALLFNWMIGGTDAHAKNYSFLIGPNVVRLAPLYDIASAYGLADTAPQRMKLAMKVAGHYRVCDIHLSHWREWARSAAIDPEALIDRIRSMSERLPDALQRVASRMRSQGLAHPIVDRLASELTSRSRQVARMAQSACQAE